MFYKTIATVFRSKEQDTAHLEAAVAFTASADGHLNVLALGTDRIQPGAFYAGASAIAFRNAMEEALEEAAAADEAAKAILRNSGISYEVTSAVAQVGGIAQIVARRAGLSDLIILPKPYGEGRTYEDVAILESSIFSTRVPVMVLPTGQSVFRKPERIVIAWNQSDEAMQAIRASIPFLKEADAVDIVIIDPPHHDPDRSDPGGLLAEMLSRHGVKPEIFILARTLPRISDVLSRHMTDQNADMLVMGAYGHSRFLEEILGGATRNMLAETKLPVLMAH